MICQEHFFSRYKSYLKNALCYIKRNVTMRNYPRYNHISGFEPKRALNVIL